MSKATQKIGLGAGFGSLLPDDFDKSLLVDKKDRIQKVDLAKLHRNEDQPRKHFDEQKIDELARSIKRHGILQPLVVSPDKDGTFTIIAGERRFRAAGRAGIGSVPVIVRTSEELDRIEIGLVENVQRVDLSPLEQALSIVKLHEQFNMGYRDIAARLGKAETTVVNTARLLQLPKEAREALEQAKISEGHARAILALKNSTRLQKELLAKIIDEKISVRQAEQFVLNSKPKNKRKMTAVTVYETLPVLSKKTGLNIRLKKARQGGSVEIGYQTEDELENIKNRLENL